MDVHGFFVSGRCVRDIMGLIKINEVVMKEVIVDKLSMLDEANEEIYVFNHMIRLELIEAGVPVLVPLTDLSDDRIRVETGRLVCYDSTNTLVFRWYDE